MLELPQRRLFATREDFAAAVSVAFADLWLRYQAESVSHLSPDWAQAPGCYSVSLPLNVAMEGGAEHGVSNIVKHAIEMKKKSIGRLARVERNEQWIVYFEAK